MLAVLLALAAPTAFADPPEGDGARHEAPSARAATRPQRAAELTRRFQELAQRYDHGAMLGVAEELLDVQRGMGDEAGALMTLADVGSLHAALGDYDGALGPLHAARAAFEQRGERELQANVCASLGLVHHRRAEYARALEYLELAERLWSETGVAAGQAYAHSLLGVVHSNLRDPQLAERHYEKALGLLGDDPTPERADLLGNLGLVVAGKDPGRALELLEASRAALDALGDRRGVAIADRSIGGLHAAAKDYAGAHERYERAADLLSDDSEQLARTLAFRAETFLEQGEAGAAEEILRAALAIDRADADRATRIWLHDLLARAALLGGRPNEALKHVRRAADLLEKILIGLADEQTIGSRAGRARVFETGIRAAIAAKNDNMLIELLERSRAAALVEALGGRAALQGVGVSRELATMEAEARRRLVAAQHGYAAANASNERKRRRAAREAFEGAERELLRVKQRIERDHKRIAGVTYPGADSPGRIRTALRKDDALVWYAFAGDEAHAVVMRKNGRIHVRRIPLGSSAEIAALCERMQEAGWNPSRERNENLDALRTELRRRLVDPLALPPRTKRVLVCPDGPLCYLPWPLLVEGPEVVCVPSGTGYRMLRRDVGKQGDRLLAVGDPVYAAEEQGRRRELFARGRSLVPLPFTRAEILGLARADDLTLLGTNATEGRLRAALQDAAREGERWAGLHFACHGLINAATPTLTALAITPAGSDDGLLTAAEVLSLSIPADIVVLSACQTGWGSYVQGEGVVGLTRAFMAAGASRVLVSLWKVDDEATSALMTKFYELTREATDEKRMSTAAALRAAQEHVRSQPKWADPYYWSAWVLWGLAD